MKDLKKKDSACGGREQAKWEKPTGAEYIKAYQEAEEQLNQALEIGNRQPASNKHQPYRLETLHVLGVLGSQENLLNSHYFKFICVCPLCGLD